MSYPVDVHGLVPRALLLGAGFSRYQISALVRSGALLAVTPGVYLPASALNDDENGGAVQRRTALYRYRCLAQPADGPVLSHQSAAAVHRLPMLKPDLRRIHVLSGRNDGGRIQRLRHIHVGTAGDAVVVVDGVPVTGLARTAVDVAGQGSFAQALAVVDAALRLGVGRDELAGVAAERQRRGSARIRLALLYGDSLSDNPGESWARAQIIEAGLPVPRLQVHYVLPGGADAYVDYDWEGRLVGEFDGLGKYTRCLRPGESVADAVIREKRREDGLRELGLQVTRGIWDDCERRLWVPRVRRKLALVGLL
ncbi:hypothetical protein [Gordonia sp. VNK21]|uniref:hypothetical protein n=1 Tax=Gordonia sp. VNK21 TaxID=3382483 RepID=UPI0038D4D1B0